MSAPKFYVRLGNVAIAKDGDGVCQATSPDVNFGCTRVSGHSDAHVAHGSHGILAVWSNNDSAATNIKSKHADALDEVSERIDDLIRVHISTRTNDSDVVKARADLRAALERAIPEKK